MSRNKNVYNIDYFTEAINIAEKFIRLLTKDDIETKLKAINALEKIPELPRDKESRQLKIYKEAGKVYKELYIAIARAIMSVLDSPFAGLHDKHESYNYSAPNEPVKAVEAIKFLPNAFVGGPIKSAINSHYPFVQKIAIEYFEKLPGDIRISEIFPKNYNLFIKRLKPKVNKQLGK